MKTIFDKVTRAQLVDRINKLHEEDKAQWGKMNACQMLKHCNLSEEMFLGKKQYARLFIGRLFGRIALKGIMKDASPMKHNQPTHPEFRIKGSGSFENEKRKWIAQLGEYDNYAAYAFMHPFFGEMKREEIGAYVYKHTDHHLRQFNC